jgi:hypothetical protein
MSFSVFTDRFCTLISGEGTPLAHATWAGHQRYDLVGMSVSASLGAGRLFLAVFVEKVRKLTLAASMPTRIEPTHIVEYVSRSIVHSLACSAGRDNSGKF